MTHRVSYGAASACRPPSWAGTAPSGRPHPALDVWRHPKYCATADSGVGLHVACAWRVPQHDPQAKGGRRAFQARLKTTVARCAPPSPGRTSSARGRAPRTTCSSQLGACSTPRLTADHRKGRRRAEGRVRWQFRSSSVLVEPMPTLCLGKNRMFIDASSCRRMRSRRRR